LKLSGCGGRLKERGLSCLRPPLKRDSLDYRIPFADGGLSENRVLWG
jgi:hypothetical protein